MLRVMPNPHETFDRQEKSDQHTYLTKLPFNPQKRPNQFAGPVMRRMNGTKELHAAIEQIYRAALDADGWPPALMAVASVAGGSGALLMVVDPLTGTVRSIAAGGFEDAFVRRYRDEFAARDPWLRALAGWPPGAVVSSDMLEAKRRQEDDPRLDEFLRAHDGGHVVGAVLGELQDDKAVVAVHRPHDAGAHRAAHLRHLELLLPHLRNALDLVARTGAAEARSACLEGLLELLPMGIFLVDGEMQVVLSNRFARRLAATRDGLVRPRGPGCDSALFVLVLRLPLASP